MSASELEAQAVQAMDEERWEDALKAWEQRFSEPEPALPALLLYALCLAQVGRLEDANGLYDEAGKAITQLPIGGRRAQLQQLFDTVGEHIEPLD